MTQTEEVEEIQVKCKGGGDITSKAIIFSLDERYLYIPWKNIIRCYNIETAEIVKNFEGCESNVIAVGFHPTNSSLLIGCSASGEVAVWKWQADLLLSLDKIKEKVEKILFFQVLPPKEGANDCEVLISWTYSNSYHIGLFSLKSLAFKRSMNVVINKSVLDVKLGNLSHSPFLSVIDNDTLVYKKITGKEVSHSKSGDRRNFTCLACHPETDCVATGDNTGRVIIWRNFFGNGTTSKTVYHWHTLPVNTLLFSETGTTLYSGGNECVLVKWKLNSLEKNFLPRLPSPIVHLCSSSHNIHLAVITQKNVIYVIDAQLQIKYVIQHMSWNVSQSAGIQLDTKNKLLLMNGYLGEIQFYSSSHLSYVYSLDVVGQNKLTEERQLKIPNTNVSKIAISLSGNWLACVEERFDDQICKEIRLKFFSFDEENHVFRLNTSIEYPHENGIRNLEFQPTKNQSDLLCATVGYDKQFKIWQLLDTTDIYKEKKNWHCLSVGYYKNLSTSALSFSIDGTLLAVAYEHCLTLWLPESCEFISSLTHPHYKKTLKIVKFGNNELCHHVVGVSEDNVIVWNMLTLSLVWVVSIKVSHLCADPLTTYMAAFTENNDLFIFSLASPKPIYQKKELITTGGKIIAAVFVPRKIENNSDVPWQRLSELYFINEKQELLCLESPNSQKKENIIEFTIDEQTSAFSRLIAETRTSHTQTNKQNYLQLESSTPDTSEIEKIFDPPIHTLAPMNLLCKYYLKPYLKHDSKEETDKDQEETSPEETLKEDSESEEDSRRKRVVKTYKKTVESKKEKKNLQKVNSKSFHWALF